MRRVRLEWFMSALLTSLSSTAAAQPVARPFAAAEIFVDVDDSWSSGRSSAVGASLTAGLDLTSHIGVQFTVDVPRFAGVTRESVYLVGFQGPLVRSNVHEERRSVSSLVLLRLRASVSQRLGFAFTSGVAIVAHSSCHHASIEPLDASGEAWRREVLVASSFTWYGGAVGVDVPVALTRRLALVPSARIILFLPFDARDSYIFRSGVGLRWSF